MEETLEQKIETARKVLQAAQQNVTKYSGEHSREVARLRYANEDLSRLERYQSLTLEEVHHEIRKLKNAIELHQQYIDSIEHCINQMYVPRRSYGEDMVIQNRMFAISEVRKHIAELESSEVYRRVVTYGEAVVVGIEEVK